jgi:hypothetical protein
MPNFTVRTVTFAAPIRKLMLANQLRGHEQLHSAKILPSMFPCALLVFHSVIDSLGLNFRCWAVTTNPAGSTDTSSRLAYI